MKKLLYLVHTPPTGHEFCLLPAPHAAEGSVSAVLLEEGVRHQTLAVPNVFVLSDDAQARGVDSPFPAISYRELLTMIFEADHVIVL
jgi:sulfur transfer complex TusBCD TusB component (DsrH family)